ncbi:hypothetical protein [Qipengyuania oceanensis]|uniref:Trimeric autotransporter adhesin YadA-like head domain-containing protein n=1 Tax=Qipengyuania oceanensis TaxID=1463597 RepID=A0A844YLD7_9SPHN|nr:hypothetical protein [Qipengyuania oceanensis]MXO63838.1 hypothetical protein [Qipengyuania oceanensis]
MALKIASRSRRAAKCLERFPGKKRKGETMVSKKKCVSLFAAGCTVLSISAPAFADGTAPCNSGSGTASTECGVDAVASGEYALAVGAEAEALGENTMAIGTQSDATGLGSQAIGYQAVSSGNYTLAAGYQSISSGQNSTAVGPFSQATGMGASAFGNGAVATQQGTVALGVLATANAIGGVSVGALATASGIGSIAIGNRASATHAGSVAIGVGAATTAASQVSLGGAGSSVRVGDIAASTAAQTGTIGVATVDENGTLGQNLTLLPAVSALQASFATQDGRMSQLEAASLSLASSVDQLATQQSIDRRDTRQGIAAAVAMGQAPLPSAPGRTSYVVNGATFRGEQAVGASIMHRLDTAEPFAIGLGVSFAGNKNNAFKVGVAGEF